MDLRVCHIIRREIKWSTPADFTDYGCYFTGCLIVARLDEANRVHPMSGEFGSMSCYDVTDEARKVLAELDIKIIEEKLAIPDLVVLVGSEDQARFLESPLMLAEDATS